MLKSKLSPSRKLKPLSFLVVNFSTTEVQCEHSLVSYPASCYGFGAGVGVGVSSVMISSGSGMRAGTVPVP